MAFISPAHFKWFTIATYQYLQHFQSYLTGQGVEAGGLAAELTEAMKDFFKKGRKPYEGCK